MTEEQIRRYARHITLASIGARGQDRLLASRAVLTLTNPADECALVYMAAAGVGTVIVAGDDRTLTEHDVKRSLLAVADDIGARWFAVAERALAGLNPDVSIRRSQHEVPTVRVAPATTLADGLAAGCAAAATFVVAIAQGSA